MDIIALKAREKQAVVKYAMKKGKSKASRQYGVSLSGVKRWCARYDGESWQSMVEKSRRPHNCPTQHTKYEEKKIRKAFKGYYERYGWDGVYGELIRRHYKRSFSGMVYAAKRLGLTERGKVRKPPGKSERRYPELTVPGEKVQIDVKEVPYNCLRGDLLKYGRHLYQWTAIDECTRMRFVYGFEEHTPENTVVNPFDMILNKLEIKHVLIPPRTPWHNGKAGRSHRNDRDIFTTGKASGRLMS